MGLENLSSVFNDISKNIKGNRVKEARSGDRPPARTSLEKQVNDTNFNILNKIDSIDVGGDSPVGNLALKAGNFTSLPFFEGNIEFKNKSQQLIGGTSFIDDDIKHNFGFTIFDDILKIKKIEFRDPNSPQTKQPNIPIVGDKVKVIKDFNRQILNLGANNRLGVGDFTFDSLYRTDHRARGIGERIQIDTGRVDKDGKAILINTLRSGMGDLSLLQPGSKPSAQVGFRGFGRGNEPYITKDIGSLDYAFGVDREGIFTDVGIPFLDDVSRLAKFYTSPKGVAFVFNENARGIIASGQMNRLPPQLGTFSGGNFGILGNTFDIQAGNATFLGMNLLRYLAQNTFIPPVPLPTVGFANRLDQSVGQRSIRKPLATPYSDIIKQTSNPGLPGGTSISSKIEQIQISKNTLDKIVGQSYEKGGELDPAREYGKRVNDDGGATDTDKHGGIKPSPFFGLGDGQAIPQPYKKNNDQISLASLAQSSGNTGENPLENDDFHAPRVGDFYVRIKDLRDGQFIYFRGFVTGITENVNPSFTPTNYIGRSEPVYLYERAERDMSFNLKLYPNNQFEFDTMYEKINRLTSLAYPEYTAENDQSSLMRMKAPFTELYMGHIGTKAKGQFGYFKSITYTVNESGDWDIDTNLPRLFDVALSYQILNKKPPSLYSDNENKIINKFYR